MVLLFTHQNSQRVHYIFNEVLGARLGETFQITTDWSFFKASNNKIKIAYTDIQPLDIDLNDCIWVFNDGLLQENFIRDWSAIVSKKLLTFYYQPKVNEVFSMPFSQFESLFISPTLINKDTFTPSEALFSKNSIPFDAFSEIFWCLSRYEEYQWESAHKIPFTIVDNRKNLTQVLGAPALYSPDIHGRYPAKQSLLFQNNWLEIPIADKLIWLVGYCIKKKPLDRFEIIPTADIDMALRFGGRSLLIMAGSLIKDFFLWPILLLERLNAVVSKKDPYQLDINTLPFITSKNNYKIFVLNHRKRTDRNKQINGITLSMELRRVKKIYGALTNHWGLHPSWQDESNELLALREWQWEKAELEKSLEIPVIHSRLHFIHLKLPKSYQIIQQLGITNDWSMGYPEALGFRAGTSKPYLWYDLLEEKSSNLFVHPFCIMDVTCKNYLNLSSSRSIKTGITMKQTLQMMGGNFCFIFHNESISNSFPWKGWKNTIINWAENPKSQTPQ